MHDLLYFNYYFRIYILTKSDDLILKWLYFYTIADVRLVIIQ